MIRKCLLTLESDEVWKLLNENLLRVAEKCGFRSPAGFILPLRKLI